MFLSSTRFLILLLLLNCVDAGRVLRKIKQRLRDLQLQEAKQRLLLRTASGHQPLQHVKEGRIQQPLNHFNRQDVSTFPQRFFVNEAFWRRPDGPVFLYIGGEGPIFEFDVLAGHHVEMAEEHGALLLALEHRFYGDSINPDGLETENLADLSSQQALADLAVFHQHMSQSFNLSSSNTWISFGGSYSGALSAWFRGKVQDWTQITLQKHIKPESLSIGIRERGKTIFPLLSFVHTLKEIREDALKLLSHHLVNLQPLGYVQVHRPGFDLWSLQGSSE
uniref:Serine protease 16 n=1 Tax=Lates calcarifer TaxID=8187 RepID=A0A4W6FHF7_LATCA